MPLSNKVESISQELRQQIEQGAFKPYNVLPTMRLLAEQFGTTPDTMKKVFVLLVNEGLIAKGAGQRYEVLNERERITTNNETFRGYMTSKKKKVKTEYLSVPDLVPASKELARVFRVPEGTSLIERRRREIVDGVVYRYSRKIYLAMYIHAKDLERMQADPTYDVKTVIQEQEPLARIDEKLFARIMIDKKEAAILNVSKGHPLMEQWKINYTPEKLVAWVSIVVFNAHFFEKRYDYAPGDEPRQSTFITDLEKNN